MEDFFESLNFPASTYVGKKLDKKEPIQIRVHNDDLIVARAYKNDMDSSLEFYEKQVDRNNEFCKEVTK